jgi:hypothetical protein
MVDRSPIPPLIDHERFVATSYPPMRGSLQSYDASLATTPSVATPAVGSTCLDGPMHRDSPWAVLRIIDVDSRSSQLPGAQLCLPRAFGPLLRQDLPGAALVPLDARDHEDPRVKSSQPLLEP